jgi:hypothetical protein
VGLEDLLEDLEDACCEQREVFGGLFDEGRQDLQGNLNVPVEPPS